MGSPVFPKIYDQMIDEDIGWLKENTESDMYQGHIIAALEHSKKQYREYGYSQEMTKRFHHRELRDEHTMSTRIQDQLETSVTIPLPEDREINMRFHREDINDHWTVTATSEFVEDFKNLMEQGNLPK